MERARSRMVSREEKQVECNEKEQVMKMDAYLNARREIERKRDQIRELRDLCESATVDMSQERVQSSGEKDRLGALVAKEVDLETELLGDISNALDTMNAIEKEIGSLADADERMVLQKRYIEGESWEKISEELHVSKMTAHRIKARAEARLLPDVT